MKWFFTVLTLALSFSASASTKYMITCEAKGLVFNVKRELKYAGQMNGWKMYWTRVDYQVQGKSGSLEAKISWRKDPRPGYNVLDIALYDKAEADFRKKGFEGGSEGFGSLDSRDEIKNKFTAKWRTHKASNDAPELNTANVNLNCELF